ncbi:hypothetical protein Rruber_04684 [Rhodococcus ruber]
MSSTTTVRWPAVAAEYRCAWHTVHDRVVTVTVTVTDSALPDEPEPVRVLGIDESLKDYVQGGTPTGARGLLAQVTGRSAATVLDWLHARDEQGRQQIAHADQTDAAEDALLSGQDMAGSGDRVAA